MARWWGRFSLVTGVIVVISASVLVAWGLRRYLHQSPRFALRKVVVEGHQRRTPQGLAKAGGLEAGRNIFGIDEAQAATAIEADPWVERATVRRELPNVMRVEVVERDPRALAVLAGRLYLVDGQGEIFKTYDDGDPTDLPVISGVAEADVGEDREAVRRRLRRALDLVADLERAQIAKRHPVQEVAVTKDLEMRVTVGTDGITLVFGPPPHRAKIAKAARVLEELRYRKVKDAILFLDNRAHPERVVVRMR
ncbi:MAG: FtsQ-type POTRA domain-containing protein [Myxococcota bacterium]